jgi:hypothetical protein
MLCVAVSTLDKKVCSAAIQGTVTAAKRIIMIVYHIRDIERELTQTRQIP